jgi:hypothetical protein
MPLAAASWPVHTWPEKACASDSTPAAASAPPRRERTAAQKEACTPASISRRRATCAQNKHGRAASAAADAVMRDALFFACEGVSARLFGSFGQERVQLRLGVARGVQAALHAQLG